MVRCPACAHDFPPPARFCPNCAAPLDSSGDPTRTSGVTVNAATADETAFMAGPAGQPLAAAAAPARNGVRHATPLSAGPASGPIPQPLSITSTSVDEGQFLPGVVVAGRYRVAGLLGRGGMGEVYRATDLTLGQAVALKFLPESMSRDDRALARFYNEARMARQVTHPNVCRVYDIGEFEGQHYISMEFVDGEDLSTLLRRIGRMPTDKATEVARKMCAGLAAAHEKGVLHRDLKPANVMIDGRGNVVLMDFGLAGLTAQTQADVRSGTPAYMSPEQLAGTEVTIKSDIYALGLVMYEIFTGRRAFEAGTLMELMQMQERAAPVSVCSVARDLDPKVERAIFRCLEHDPTGRPASAMAVAAALGGDALAAALAAGETPSPELVAAAGETQGLQPRWALAWLGAALALTAVAAYFAAAWSLTSRLPLDAPPDALALQARNMLRQLGYTAKPADTAYAFEYASGYMDYLRTHPGEAAVRWRNPAAGAPPLIDFWYRESPGYMTPELQFGTAISTSDPPLIMSGMIALRTDTEGKLLLLQAVPPQREPPPATPPPAFDWALLFRAAGRDISHFQPAEPMWTPLASFDARAAWTGTDAATNAPLRIEAAAWRGKPVFFRTLGPWSAAERMNAGERNPQIAAVAMIWLLLVAACAIAWRSFRTGHGDRRGAQKLAGLYFICMLAARFIGGHHTPVFGEANLVWSALTVSALNAAAIWTFYIALEPWVRRRWPETMISWSRFTTKGVKDPRVGRDILYGAAMGAFFSIVKLVQIHLHGVSAPPSIPNLSALSGLRDTIAFGLDGLDSALFDPMIVLFLLFLMRLILRRPWIAATAAVAVLTAMNLSAASAPAIDLPFVVLSIALEVLALLHFGIPAVIVANVISAYLLDVPITFDFSSWYCGFGLLAIAACAAIGWYGFKTALAGKAVWSDEVG